MPLRTTDAGLMPDEGFARLRAFAAGARSQGQQYLGYLQANSVDSDWVFSMLDQLRGFIANVSAMAATSGLDPYAQSQGYPGSISADAVACNAAAQACINWVVANFPKDSTNSWLLAQSLNADGTRTARLFTPAQTAGLRTALQNFINTFA